MIKFLLPRLLSLPAQASQVRIVTDDSPPFQTVFNGTVQGPMLSIMKQVCKEARLECNFELMALSDAHKQAMEGKADVIFSIATDAPDHAGAFYVSPKIVETKYSFFVTGNSNWKYGGVLSLEGMTIGSADYSGAAIAQGLLEERMTLGFKPFTLIVEPDIAISYLNLITGTYGKHGAVVANKDVGFAMLRRNSIIGPKPAGDIKTITYGYGVSRNSKQGKEISDRMDAALKRLQKRGEILGTLRFYGLKAAP